MLRWWIFATLVVAIAGIGAATYILLHRPVPDNTEWVEGYSAQVISTDLRDPRKSYSGFVFSNVLSTPRAFRLEMNFADRRRIRIWRQDDGMSAVLDPDARTYWTPTLKGSVRSVSGGGPAIDNGVKRLVGQERINGRLADHWEVTHIGEPLEQYWEDLRLHVTLKSLQPGIRTYELTNIKEGRQPDGRFTIPQNYRKIDPPIATEN